MKKHIVPALIASVAMLCLAATWLILESGKPEILQPPKNLLETKGVGELSTFLKLQPHEVTPRPDGWVVSWNGRHGVITVECDQDLRITKWVLYHDLDLK